MSEIKSVEELPLVFGASELAQVMGMSINKAYQTVKSPHFPKKKIGREYYIYKENFIEWMKKQNS